MSTFKADSDQHGALGKLVAGLKAKLHDAEQRVSDLKGHEVDWNLVVQEGEALIALVKKLHGTDTADTPAAAVEHPVVEDVAPEPEVTHRPHGRKHK